jgi:hypothetical protein
MTLADVEAILAGPPRDERQSDWSPAYRPRMAFRPGEVARVREWIGHECAVLVDFDGDGRVMEARLCHRRREGPITLLRSLLGL